MLEESKEKPSGPGALSGAIENTVSLISSKENGPSNQDTFYGDKGFSVQSMNQPPGYWFFDTKPGNAGYHGPLRIVS